MISNFGERVKERIPLPPSPYFVFDLDETLIASKESILALHRKIFALLGRPFPEEESHLFYTLDRDQVRARFFNTKEVALIEKHIPELTRTLGFRGIRKKRHADTLLRVLVEKGIPRGILTNRGDSTGPLLRHLGWDRLFFPVLSAAEIPYPKPHPEALGEFAQRAGVPLTSLVFVGDSEVDEECAKNSGVVFLGVGRNYPSWFAHLGELKSYLASSFTLSGRGTF